MKRQGFHNLFQHKPYSLITISLGIAAILYGFYHALGLQWFCDDIFITLRYVDNWINGKGIVYNEGEFVEGYTHFLWLLLLRFSSLFTDDLLQVAINLGLVSYVLLLGLSVFNSLKVKSTFPIVAIALAVHYDFNIWASGGLETMFYTLLLLGAFSIAFLSHFSFSKKLVLVGTILTLLVLTRPDAALFILLANFLVILKAMVDRKDLKEMARQMLLLNSPLAFILIPYLSWKLAYYGDIFPNTYYAKAAGVTQFDKGFYYLFSYFGNYWTSLLGLLVFTTIIIKKWSSPLAANRKLKLFFENKSWAMMGTLVLMISLYSFLFIARVGGDYMYARFLIPLIPLCYLLLEIALLELGNPFKKVSQSKVYLAALLTLFLIALSPVEKQNRDALLIHQEVNELKAKPEEWIVDERLFFQKNRSIEDLAQKGKLLKPFFRDIDSKFLCIGDNVFAYYAGVNYSLEGYGLTDPEIAKLPADTSQRVGHQKVATYGYARQKGVQFSLMPTGLMDELSEVEIQIGDQQFNLWLVQYDKAFIQQLKSKFGEALSFVDIEKEVDSFIQEEIQKQQPDFINNLYSNLHSFYFKANNDTKTKSQEQVFLSYLNKEKRTHGL